MQAIGSTDDQPLYVDRDKFFDVARELKPDITRAEFEEEWENFQAFKKEHQQRAQVKLNR